MEVPKSPYSFFTFDIWVKIVTAAPIEAVIPPIIAARTVGFSINPPDACVGCTTITGAVLSIGAIVAGVVDDATEYPLKGGNVPNALVACPGMT
jgi:hypothetical protein